MVVLGPWPGRGWEIGMQAVTFQGVPNQTPGAPQDSPFADCSLHRVHWQREKSRHGHPGKEDSDTGVTGPQKDYLQLANSNAKPSNTRNISWISFPKHFGTSQGDNYQQAPTPTSRSWHISFPKCARANHFIFPLLCYSPMIKTGIETLSPWREFYHRFHTSGHLSHRAPRNCRRAGGEERGKSGHIFAAETPTRRRAEAAAALAQHGCGLLAGPGSAERSLDPSSASRDFPCVSRYTIITYKIPGQILSQTVFSRWILSITDWTTLSLKGWSFVHRQIWDGFIFLSSLPQSLSISLPFHRT